MNVCSRNLIFFFVARAFLVGFLLSIGFRVLISSIAVEILHLVLYEVLDNLN